MSQEIREIQEAKKSLSRKAGMTTGSRKQTYNGFADSAKENDEFPERS